MEWSWNNEGRQSLPLEFLVLILCWIIKAWKEACIFILNLYLEINRGLCLSQLVHNAVPAVVREISRVSNDMQEFDSYNLVCPLKASLPSHDNQLCLWSSISLVLIYISLFFVFQGKSSDKLTAKSGSDIDDHSSPFGPRSSTCACLAPVDEEVSCRTCS
jgi:hypothetical protein